MKSKLFISCMFALVSVYGSSLGQQVKVFDDSHPTQLTNYNFDANHLAAVILTGDLDGDGDLDAFLSIQVKRPRVGHHDYMAVNNGSGSFALKKIGPFFYHYPRQSALCDIDLDGDLDIISTGEICINNGDGSFRAQTTNIYSYLGLAAGDLNGDHYPDLIITFGWGMGVYINNKNGGFSGPTILNNIGGSSDFGVALEDVDRDGDLDCAAGNQLLLNDGHGNLTVSCNALVQNPNEASKSGRAFGDLNGDGWPDLVLGDGSILLNDKHGSFSLAGRVSFTAANVALGDIDKDGRLDIVTSSPIQVFRGNGDGTFSGPVQTLQTGTAFWHDLALGDADGDGWLDLFSSSFKISGDYGSPSVLFNLHPVFNRPPVIEFDKVSRIWPPNHRLVDVSPNFRIYDPDNDPLTIKIRCFSNEGDLAPWGWGWHSPDFKNEYGGRGVLVRAERLWWHRGRFYILYISADDGRGGVTTAAGLVAVVPRCRRTDTRRLENKARDLAEALKNALDNGGEIPKGVVEVGLGPRRGCRQ